MGGAPNHVFLRAGSSSAAVCVKCSSDCWQGQVVKGKNRLCKHSLAAVVYFKSCLLPELSFEQ